MHIINFNLTKILELTEMEQNKKQFVLFNFVYNFKYTNATSMYSYLSMLYSPIFIHTFIFFFTY